MGCHPGQLKSQSVLASRRLTPVAVLALKFCRRWLRAAVCRWVPSVLERGMRPAEAAQTGLQVSNQKGTAER